jgi:hypothetical protein
MNRFTYTAPQLDTRFASAIGDGFANAGAAAINYDTKMRNDDLLKKKQALAQSKFDQEVQDNNDQLGAYASLGAKNYPELMKSSGYDAQNPNVITQNKLGNLTKAQMEFDKSRPKMKTIEGANNYWNYNPVNGQTTKTDIPVYRDKMDGLTSDEKMFARIYGVGTPEYNRAINNLAAKKQMIPVQTDNGAVQYILPNIGGTDNKPTVIGTKATAEKPKEKDYNSVNAVIQTFSDLDYLDENYRDDYVGAIDGTMNELLRKAGVPESSFTGNKGYSLYQQAMGNLNNKERNALMGAVLTPQEIAAYNKQTITEADDNTAFKQKLARKRQILSDAFERKYNEIADTYGEDAANKMFETSKRASKYRENRAQRRSASPSQQKKPSIQEAQQYMEELRRLGITK